MGKTAQNELQNRCSTAELCRHDGALELADNKIPALLLWKVQGVRQAVLRGRGFGPFIIRTVQGPASARDLAAGQPDIGPDSQA